MNTSYFILLYLLATEPKGFESLDRTMLSTASSCTLQNNFQHTLHWEIWMWYGKPGMLGMAFIWPCFNTKTMISGMNIFYHKDHVSMKLYLLYKNIERHTVHTIVSWPNPKQWVIVHTSNLMMIIRQSIYILSIITRGMGKVKTYEPHIV